MKTKLRHRFAGLASRILDMSQETPKYVFDGQPKSSTQPNTVTRGPQLASYVRYTVHVERRL